jgi:hypothetical protein
LIGPRSDLRRLNHDPRKARLAKISSCPVVRKTPLAIGKPLPASGKSRLATGKTRFAMRESSFAMLKASLAMLKRHSLNEESRAANVRPSPEAERPVPAVSPQGFA